jgi:Cu-Zn family superoxide dismutase
LSGLNASTDEFTSFTYKHKIMTQKRNYVVTALLVIGLSSVMIACNNNGDQGSGGSDTVNNSTNANNNTSQSAEASLSSVYTDTTVNGTARFEQTSNGRVKLTLDLTIPAKANRSVAVHIHEHGDCGDTARHAGGHWNPTGVNHGKWGENAFHAGDIGNISLDGSGKGTFEVETDLWSVGGDERKNILNRSLVVHGGVDDYTTQPSGNSGTRIGCGTIKAKGGN